MEPPTPCMLPVHALVEHGRMIRTAARSQGRGVARWSRLLPHPSPCPTDPCETARPPGCSPRPSRRHPLPPDGHLPQEGRHLGIDSTVRLSQQRHYTRSCCLPRPSHRVNGSNTRSVWGRATTVTPTCARKEYYYSYRVLLLSGETRHKGLQSGYCEVKGALRFHGTRVFQSLN